MIYVLRFAIIACLGLLFGTTASAAPLNFYGVSERGNFYSVSYEAGTGVTSTFVKNLATTAYYYGALDYGPNGSLYMLRGAGGTSTNPGQLYSLSGDGNFTPTLVNLGTGNVLSGMNMGPASSAGTAAGLAFKPDGTFYAGTGVRFVSPQNRTALFLVDPAPDPTRLDFFWDDYTPAFGAASIQGLQWYNDQLLALTATGDSDPSLHLRTITHGLTGGTVYDSSANLDAGGLGDATFMTPGDLAIIEDTLFAAVGPDLYTYDWGSGAPWTHLGTLPEPFTGLASLPGQTIPSPVPEPGNALLSGAAVLGLILYSRRARPVC
ncbi:MAG: hypothetical protein A2078_08960 [Nitrospirae bacterium GWC2_57_9]|nr:MAG: hypothetical protein A2078_08960 [Nitrospirae bacterium GWC2_57_9]